MADENLLVLAKEFTTFRKESRAELKRLTETSKEIGPIGPAGKDGKDGKDGKQGEQGVPGRDGATGPKGPKGDTGPVGPAGKTGTSVVDAEVDFDGHLRLKLSTGKIIDAGEIPVEKAGVGAVHVAGNAWQITVSTTAPANPQLNQLWLDIS